MTTLTDLWKYATPSQAMNAAFFKDRVNLFVIGGHLTIYMINIEDIMIKIYPNGTLVFHSTSYVDFRRKLAASNGTFIEIISSR